MTEQRPSVATMLEFADGLSSIGGWVELRDKSEVTVCSYAPHLTHHLRAYQGILDTQENYKTFEDEQGVSVIEAYACRLEVTGHPVDARCASMLRDYQRILEALAINGGKGSQADIAEWLVSMLDSDTLTRDLAAATIALIREQATEIALRYFVRSDGVTWEWKAYAEHLETEIAELKARLEE